MLAFILEGLGTTELLVIVVVALILFGPRRLPQLSRSLGKSLGEFKRASEDFKRQWEKEVALEEREKDARIERAMLPEDNSILGDALERHGAVRAAAADAADAQEGGAAAASSSSSALATSPTIDPSRHTSEQVAAEEMTTSEPMRKRDWL
jgi:sec-independent protein translocase protein TatB